MELNAAILRAWELDELSDGLLAKLQRPDINVALDIESLPKAIDVVLSDRQDVALATSLLASYCGPHGQHSAFLEAQALISARQGDIREAVENLHLSCFLAQHSFSSWTLLGSLLFELSDLEGIMRLSELTAQHASKAESGFLLLLVALLERDLVTIQTEVTAWLQLPCLRDADILAFVQHLDGVGERRLAEAVFGGVRKESSMQARFCRAMLLSQVAPAESQRIARDLVAEFPGRYLLHYALASGYWHDHRYELAAVHFEKSLHLAPWHSRSRLFLGCCHLKIGRTEVAHKVAVHLAETHPEWWEVYVLLANTYSKQGRHREAAIAQLKARRLRESDTPAGAR